LFVESWICQDDEWIDRSRDVLAESRKQKAGQDRKQGDKAKYVYVAAQRPFATVMQ